MKIDSNILDIVRKKVKVLTDNGSTKTHAIEAVCRDMNLNIKAIMRKLYPHKKSKKHNNDIKASEGSYVVFKKKPNKPYEVININNKDDMILRDVNDNSETSASEDEVISVVTETMMKQNLKEANYNLSIDGLQTMDADTLSQILTLAGQAESGVSDTVEPMETDYVQSEFDSPETLPVKEPMGDMETEETGIEATDAEIEPSYDDFEDVGYEFENDAETFEDDGVEEGAGGAALGFIGGSMVGHPFLGAAAGHAVEEIVDEGLTPMDINIQTGDIASNNKVANKTVEEDVLLDPRSDDETYNSERKNTHEKEELEEAYNGNYETLKQAVIRNEVSTDEAISALLDMGEATDEEEALDIINGMKMESDVDELEEEGVESEGDFESYVIYEFDGDECLGSRNATTWDEAEKQAMEIHGAGHDAIVAGVNTNGEEIDLGKKGEFLQDKESLNEDDMGDIDMYGIEDTDMSGIEDIDISESEEIVDGEEIIEEETNNVSNKSLKNKLMNIVSSNGFDDSEGCYHMFDCMSPNSKKEFLTKYNYEDIGYAYDADRDLAYKLIDNMNDEELVKCQELLNKCMSDGEEIFEEETNFDDEIAECLRLAGVELNEVSDEKATKGKKDLPQVVGKKTAFSNAKKDGFKPGENQRPNYKCVKTKDVMGKKASEGTARPMNISEMVSKKKIESICETASRMYAKKDHSEWLALDRRYVEKLIKEGVSYSNASKMLLKAKKGN